MDEGAGSVPAVTLFARPEPPAPRRVSLVRLASEIARSVSVVGKVSVEGEVHRPQRRPNGRIYFTLRDRAAQVSVTCPAARAKRCRTVDGERVSVVGSLEWVSAVGDLRLVADEVVPVGSGAVAAMIAEARDRLRADGLIDRPRRRLPRLPSAIGVICGSDAAVRADIESVVAARFPGYPLVFREVTMSGGAAADAIADSIADLDTRVDVLIIARGGGDATQLLPFSDESLCRAICAASIPVVAAIGHEGDRPLCDEVADHRFGTPSLAAAAVVPDRAALEAGLEMALTRATASLDRRLFDAESRLASVDRDRAVLSGVDRAADRLTRTAGRLELVHPRRRLPGATSDLAAIARQLDALSPVRVLERGYAIVRTADGSVVRDPVQVGRGDHLDVTVAAGRFAARAE